MKWIQIKIHQTQLQLFVFGYLIFLLLLLRISHSKTLKFHLHYFSGNEFSSWIYKSSNRRFFFFFARSVKAVVHQQNKRKLWLWEKWHRGGLNQISCGWCRDLLSFPGGIPFLCTTLIFSESKWNTLLIILHRTHTFCSLIAWCSLRVFSI